MTKRHFAKIGLNNKVEDITIIDSSSMTDVTGVEQEQMGINFLKRISNWDLWKQFWTDGSQRKNPAAKGFTYDETRDAFIPINYNTNPVVPYKGSAIFLHLTQNYKPTAGCIAISIKDFLILAKCIKSSDKIKIG